MVEQPEEASSGSRPEQGDHAVRDLRDGLVPLPDQHPAPREEAAQHNLEGGSELCCFLVHYLLRRLCCAAR